METLAVNGTPSVTETPLVTETKVPEITPTGYRKSISIDRYRILRGVSTSTRVGDEIIWVNEGLDTTVDKENNGENWPLSNYPIFIALILLADTAVTLSMGDEKQAEDLAIYAYYFIVLGVGIRFLEFTVTTNSRRPEFVAVRTSSLFRHYFFTRLHGDMLALRY